MERSKIKNIVIVLLLLLNLFFVLLNLGLKQAEAQSQHAIEENVTKILENHGIQFDVEDVPWTSQLRSYVQSRERYDDRAFAEGMLGEILTEVSGASWTYYGTQGAAEFSQYGAFEVHYNAPFSIVTHTQEEALSFLEGLGIKAQIDTTRSTKETLWFWQTVDGLPVFTCDIQLSYVNGYLVSISGRRLTGPLEPGSESLRAASTLLIGLAQTKVDGLIDCAEILEIREGYLNPGLTPVPVWRVRTDAGILYLDCVSGEIRYP